MKSKKKRLVGLLVTLCMILTIGIPTCVWADDCSHNYGKDAVCTVCGDAPELTDAQKTSWAAYCDFKAAYTAGDLEALKTATDAFEKANEDLEMEEQAFLSEMDEEFWGTLISANVVMTANSFYKEFVDNPTAKTAYDFVAYYDMDDLEEYKADIARFMPDIETVYAEAKAVMPAEDVVSVYEAYLNVQSALSWGSVDEDFYAAVDGFEAVLDAYNEMSDDSEEATQARADLAALMGMENGEDAWSQILSDWVNMNIILSVDEVYQAYVENPSAETAVAFTELYDSLFNDPAYADEERMELVRTFFYDIDDVYADAAALLAAGDEDSATDEEVTAEEPAADTEDQEGAPATGDDTQMMLWIGLLLVAGAGIAGMRSKREE